MTRSLEKLSYILVRVPDSVTEKIITEQYAYTSYACYDVLIEIDCLYDKQFHFKYEKKRVLVFLCNCDGNYHQYKEFFSGCTLVHFVVFVCKNVNEQNQIIFSVTKSFSKAYIEYLMFDYPQVIVSEMDKNLLIEIGGYNLHNICYLMQECYYKQISLEKIRNQNMLSTEDNDVKDKGENLIFLLGMEEIGINRELVMQILKKEELSFYLDKQYLFSNGDYMIPNIHLHLCYKDYIYSDILVKWQIFQKYIKTLKDENDTTIIYQVIWLLKKTLELGTSVPIEVGDIIFSIEDILHRIYRFLRNDELLEFERLCKQYFQKDIKKYIYILVNEAILYEDTEQFEISRNRFEEAEQLCEKSLNNKVYIYVMDEFSRLLEKTGEYYTALDKLYSVEKFYQNKQDIKRLQNVRNRIGLNLCFTGDIKQAVSCLEKLYLGEFNGRFNMENALSCEVANNLTLCYMEAGNYGKALKIQDELYRFYLTFENIPVNYATDILQNKGSVYLYQHEYEDAVLCFEQALKDEKNPFSRELILENYLYAKAFGEKKFEDCIHFFENQVRNNAGYETIKMLAELYFAGSYFIQCFRTCENLLKEIKYENNRLLFITLDILWMQSMIKLKKLSLHKRLYAINRVNKYEKYVLENIGKKSPYYEKVRRCRLVLWKFA